MRITERSGGAGRLMVYHNGTPMGTPEIEDYNPRKTVKGDRAVYEFTIDAALEPGVNIIGVSAFDRQQVIESEIRQVEIRAEYAAARPGKPVLYVLAAAITDYADNPLYADLTYPGQDAEAIAALFTGQKTGSLYADVVVKRLGGRELTRAGFRRAFNELKGQVTPQDTFVFFYAGHGDVDEGKDFFLVPWDAADGERIEKEDIIDSIAKIRARNTLVQMDICRSGALIDMKTAFGRLLEKMGQKAILVAASGEQSAVESGGIGHGVFTKTLLEAGEAASGGERDSPRAGGGAPGGTAYAGRRLSGRGGDPRFKPPGPDITGASCETAQRGLFAFGPVSRTGEVSITTASEGILVIEGAAGSRERLAAGGKVTRRFPEKGYTVTMLYADGNREAYPLEVRNNGTYEVKFSYRAPAAVVPVARPARPIPEGFEINGTVLVKYTGNEENVIIPGDLGITEIGKGAFEATKVKSVVIPPGVTRIGDAAFYYCFNLTSIHLPDSVTNIGNYAFCYCKSLTSITIPVGVTSIEEDAFYNCLSLTSINVESGNPAYASRDGVLYDKNFTALVRY